MEEQLNVLLIEDYEDDALLEVREIKRQYEALYWKRVDRKIAFHEALGEKQWDLILCDYMLPDLKPEEVLLHMRENELDIPVIIVSGHVDEETVVELMKAGAADYVLKDNLTRLGLAVKREVVEARHRQARRKAESSLRENRRFLASLLQTLPGMVYRSKFDKQWAMQYVSQSCLELTGYDPYYLINNNKISFSEVIHPDDRERVWEEVARDVKAHRPFQITYRINTADGEIRWVMDNGRGLVKGMEEDGLIIEGYIFDVTDAKRMELALEESRLRFRSISDTSHDAIVMINEEGQVEYWNLAATRMFEYTDLEIIGRNLSHYVLPAEQSKKENKIKDFSRTSLDVLSGRTVEMTAQRKSGDLFPIELSLSTLELQNAWHAVASIRDITERKQSINALQESEEQFRRLVEESVEGICLIRDEKFLFVNPRFQAIFGYTEKELLNPGFAIRNLLASEDQDLEADIFERYQNGSLESSTIAFTGQHRSGDQVSLEASLVEIQYGGTQAILVILRDITEQMAAEQKLRESEQRFRLLAENAEDVIFRFAIKPYRHYEYISPAVERITGYSPEDFYNDPDLALKIVHPEDRDVYRTRFHSLEDREALLRLRWVGRDGRIIWAEQRNVLVRDPEGNPVAMEGIIRDITSQFAADEELRVLSHVIEHSPNSIAITNAEGIVEYVNKRFCEMSGYSPEEVIGKTPRILRSGEHANKFYEELWKTVLSGGVWRGELTNRRKNGELFTESAIISPIMDEEGTITHLFALKVDISERVQLLKERDQLEGELSRQFHLSQVGLLASGIAHNLRSPLSVITMYVNMMQSKLEKVLGSPPDDALALFEVLEDIEGKSAKILSSTQRIEKIIDDILSYQRMNQILSEETIDLNTLLSADTAILQADLDLKHKVSTRLDLSPISLWVRVRPSDLSQIYLNLVSNARDAMLEREVRVLTIRSGNNETKKQVWFEVHDTGSGIPSDNLEHLGDPFFTTKAGDAKARERGSGTGLGLYMTKRQLERFEGQMDVVSIPGDTTFRITIPAADAPPSQETEQP